MKYLALVYHDERVRDALPPAEWEAMMHEAIAHNDALSARDAVLGGSALQPVHTARTIRPSTNGRRSVTDGPFAETREQLAGYIVLDAPDLAAAVAMIEDFPIGRIGAIEVRPLWGNADVIARHVDRV
jgi:hypothetical protein